MMRDDVTRRDEDARIDGGAALALACGFHVHGARWRQIRDRAFMYPGVAERRPGKDIRAA